jgi:hypothetical protein
MDGWRNAGAVLLFLDVPVDVFQRCVGRWSVVVLRFSLPPSATVLLGV